MQIPINNVPLVDRFRGSDEDAAQNFVQLNENGFRSGDEK
jgi:hypothetical protein